MIKDDYYYSGQYAEEQAEADVQKRESLSRSGPWHISKHTEGRYALIYDSNGFEVARVCYPNRDANAQLIAGAPELLKATRDALYDKDRHIERLREAESILKELLATVKRTPLKSFADLLSDEWINILQQTERFLGNG